SCFKIMHDLLHFDMGGLYPAQFKANIPPDICLKIVEEVQYACCFWGDHLRFLHGKGKQCSIDIQEKVLSFLKESFLYWLEVMSILACLPAALSALSATHALSTETEVTQLAWDYQLFLHQFSYPISQAYPHIYISALPLAPRHSLIWKQYIDQVPQTLTILSNADEYWPVQLCVITGHEYSFTSVALSPNGSQIVSGSFDNTICIWDAVTQQPMGEPLQGHEHSVTSVAFSPNGSQIVSGSRDKTIRIWDAVTQQPIGEPLQGHEHPVTSVALSPNGSQIVSGSSDNTIRIWDAVTQQPIGEPLQGHEHPVTSVAFSPN
ncbi:WD40 repeat-like protein, partial [Gymnopus androsaceus JB14]